MTDLERIKHIEKTLGIKLHQTSLENLFTDNAFLATYDFWSYSLFERLDPKFFRKGVRNYSTDRNGNVIGLALDFTNLMLLESDFLQDFVHLQKLRLKSSTFANYQIIGKLMSLNCLALSYNNLSNADFLKDLTGLTSLDLRNNNLPNADFLKNLTGLTSLALGYNNLSNADFLQLMTNLSTLDLIGNKSLEIKQEVLQEILNPLRIITAYFQIEDSIYQSYKDTPKKSGN